MIDIKIKGIPVNIYRKAKAAHLRIGRRGEKIASSFLASRNFDIILRNYRCSSGEIDIIARDGSTICFVEVKTRRHNSKSRPARGLTEKQRKRIRKAANHYMNKINNPLMPFRFDLLEVILSPWDIRELRYWKGEIR